MRSIIAAFAAVSALAFAAPAQADEVTGEAYGIAATGLISLDASPHSVSATKEMSSKRLLKLPANPLIEATVNEASATKYQARAIVTDVSVGQFALRAQAVSAACENGVGNASLARVALGDTEIPVYPQPNSGLTIPLGQLGNAAVVLNQQVKLPDGGMRVTAIHVDVVLGGVIKQTLDIASATCSGPARTTGATTATAPMPASIPGHLAVAG